MIEEFRIHSQEPSSNISCEENTRRLSLKSPQDHLFYKVRVDKGLDCTQETKCDFLIIKESDDSIWLYVELKGKDLKKAFKQIEVTHNRYKNTINTNKKFYGAIVASKVKPAVKTIQQRFTAKMKDKYNMKFFVKCQSLELKYNKDLNSIEQ